MLSTIERRQKILEILSERRYEKMTNLAIELNVSRRTICYDIEENGKEKRVVNQHKTIAAREKQNKIQEEFKNWIFLDPERREDLEKEYNAKFNQILGCGYNEIATIRACEKTYDCRTESLGGTMGGFV